MAAESLEFPQFPNEPAADGPVQALPLTSFGVELQQACDRGCHCQAYRGANVGLRRKGVPMPEFVLGKMLTRIDEHAKEHELDEVDVILHGGEPFKDPEYAITAARTIRARLERIPTVNIHAQTGGSTLDPAFCDQLSELDVKVGVSFNGPRRIQNKSRPFLPGEGDGRDSYDATCEALELLRDHYPHIFGGILCTLVDVSDPDVALEVYKECKKWLPRNIMPTDKVPKFKINFLLPHNTWDDPPPGKKENVHTTPYAEFLKPIAQKWFRSSDNRLFSVPLFDDIGRGYFGKPATTDMFGSHVVRLAFVSALGEIAQTDALKVISADTQRTGLNIFRNSFDDVLRVPSVIAQQAREKALGEVCLSNKCGVLNTCVGGQYTHRFSAENGHLNPSVYCDDLAELIPFVHSFLRRPEEAVGV